MNILILRDPQLTLTSYSSPPLDLACLRVPYHNEKDNVKAQKEQEKDPDHQHQCIVLQKRPENLVDIN